MWLNLHMQRVSQINIFSREFPSDQPEGQKVTLRRCTSFGEAASSIGGERLSSDQLISYFRCFYNGLSKSALIWFAYDDPNNSFERPINFQFDSATSSDNRKIFKEMIRPNLLPTISCGRKSYEFYYPSVAARQLGFGQAPIRLYFSDLIKPRDEIPNNLALCRLLDQVPDIDMDDLDTWKLVPFTSSPFRTWWIEWSQHLFCKSATPFCQVFDPSVPQSSTVKDFHPMSSAFSSDKPFS